MTSPSPPSSPLAVRVLDQVQLLQARLARRMEQAAAHSGGAASFERVGWLRDEGRHGGGHRLVSSGGFFDRASCNVSAIHYDDLPHKRLSSATALSCIVHPSPPLAPSMHMHMSFTEMREGRATWRLMADLNPSTPIAAHTERFTAAIRGVVGDLYAEGERNGNLYFQIPALDRHRGVAHFYLEGHDSGDFAADTALVDRLSAAVIEAYALCVEEGAAMDATAAHEKAQLAYHTLYLFQVLTLDRGTTSGLLVHDQNDLGIMGSLPSRIDPNLLASWEAAVPEIQRPLVRALVAAVGDGRTTDAAKLALAAAVRLFYRENPAALGLQARGEVVPPTVANHR